VRSGAKDRRAIDPPPVLQLRFFRTVSTKNGDDVANVEVEIEDYSDLRYEGLLCHVDLFPAPESASVTSTASEYNDALLMDTSEATLPVRADGTAASLIKLTEGLKCQDRLAGSMFVQANNVPLGVGRALLFVFADLSVKVEGDYILRYRCFDVLSQAAGTTPAKQPVLAQCVGGAFRVYPTKECPRLPASTELSKRLSRLGVRINIREGERGPRGRRASDAKTDGTSYGKRKSGEMQRSDGTDEDSEDHE